MPTINTYTIPANQIRRGDYLNTGPETTWDAWTTDPADAKVGEAKVGRTKVTVHAQSDGRRIAYLDMDDQVQVFREEETEEENEARFRRIAAERLTETLKEGLETYDPERMFSNALLTRKGDPYTKEQRAGLVFNALDALLEGQAKFDIYMRVNRRLANPDGDVIKAFADVIAVILEPGQHNQRALSRSTSVTSNLASDVMRQEADLLLSRGLAGIVLLKEVTRIWAENI